MEYENNYLLILNYDESKSQIDINDYAILEKYQNCLFLKKMIELINIGLSSNYIFNQFFH